MFSSYPEHRESKLDDNGCREYAQIKLFWYVETKIKSPQSNFSVDISYENENKGTN